MPAESQNTMSQERRRTLLMTAWRARPLSSLRWQLTIVYSLVFMFFIILFIFLVYSPLASASNLNPLSGSGIFALLLLILVSIGLIYKLTGFMLKPLREITDAAQTLALGDLQQKERLLPYAQGNDEVSKIAVSLNELVDRLERTGRNQKQGEERARRFFSDASHQLRTPLTSLRGFTEILLRGGKDNPETMQRILKMMRTEAERMTRLVNDLLMLARLDEGSPLQTQVIDLVDVALESVEQTKLLATDGRKVTLCFETDERLNVQANPDKLKQALHILFDNALKYGRPAPDGWIRLKLDKKDGYALVHIIDNGKGIAADDLPHVFERFYRGQHIPTYEIDGMSAPPPAGAGLGLSIALAIVQAHKGDITVVSEPDKETNFTVKLPCVGK